MNKSILGYIIEGCILLGILSFVYTHFDKKLDISEQNVKAYKNKIEQLELKNGELITTRDSYILKTKELQDVLDVSKKEIRSLEKKLDASLTYISKIESNIKIDTLKTSKDSITYRQDTTDIKFNYRDDWISFNGLTNIFNKESKTFLYDFDINVPLKMGISENYKIFVHTPNPHVTFSSIEGAVIDGSKLAKKEKKWNIGVQAGFGGLYDIFNKNISIGPYIGAGMEYNF